jgi:putative two-component system response regulator
MVILVVDDNPVSARLVERVLQSDGYHTAVAYNGREALGMLETTADVRLVVCDLRMPEMDGLEFLRELRSQPLWRELPVLMCTSVGEADSVKEAIRLGVQSYVRKPVSALVLLQKVRSLVDARPVLRERRQVMLSLGLDPRMGAAYDDLASQFSRVIEKRLNELEIVLNHKGAVAKLDLGDLVESAQVIGADRLLNVLERINASESDPSALRTEYTFLSKELKLLLQALPAPQPRRDIAYPAAEPEPQAEPVETIEA